MKVKTFHALTMQDAIRAIKAELGPDAIILSSKEVQQGGRLLRLFNRPVLEVMAAAEQDEPWMPPAADAPARRAAPPRGSEPVSQVQPVEAAPPEAFQETLHSLLKSPHLPPSAGPAIPAAQASRAPKRDWKKERMRRLRAELQDLSRLLGASLPREMQSLGSHLPSDLALFCRSLINQGLRPSTAESLGLEVWPSFEKDGASSPSEAPHDALRAAVAGRIRVSGPLLAGQGDHTVSLMLGPSGAGKTTAITKLAAHYRLEEKKNVSIVTFDTYRPASVEQLRMYASVLGVPFASARSAKQVQAGLRRQAHVDVVLIDMPGIGPEDVASAMELHQLLRDQSELHMHLVVPASMREPDLFRIYDRVKHLPLLRLLFTKLDETACFGSVFELAYQTGVPLSYWSAGQRVPEDIELATATRLASFLLSQRYTAPSVAAQPAATRSSTHEMPEPVAVLTGQNER